MGVCTSRQKNDKILSQANNKIPTLEDMFKDVILRAKVVYIYDGDTCKLVCEYPIKGKLVRYPCRMYGYDSPEMKPLKNDPNREQEKEAAVKAKDYLMEIFNETYGLVWVRGMGLDKYGRLLATVHKSRKDAVDNKNSFNDRMIEAGHGYPYTGGTKEKFSASV